MKLCLNLASGFLISACLTAALPQLSVHTTSSPSSSLSNLASSYSIRNSSTSIQISSDEILEVATTVSSSELQTTSSSEISTASLSVTSHSETPSSISSSPSSLSSISSSPSSEPISTSTLASTTSSVSSALPSISANSSGFNHIMPPPRTNSNKDPSLFYQLPSGLANGDGSYNDPNCPSYTSGSILQQCMWKKYNTDAWLASYIKSLLAFNGVSSTKDLDYEWPYYLAIEYQGRSWSCYWTSRDCIFRPQRPSDDSNLNNLNAFFVLQAIDHWMEYMHAHRTVIQFSIDNFINNNDATQGLQGIVNQFNPGSLNRIPGRSDFNAMSIYFFFGIFLMKVPVVEDVIKAINLYDNCFGLFPKPPQDDTISKLKAAWQTMANDYDLSLSKSFATFVYDYEFAKPLLEKGGYLARPSREITDVWNDPTVWAKGQLVNFQHSTILQAFKAYGIFLHGEINTDCLNDGKWMNQNYPSQQCFRDPATQNHNLYVFPVSWYFPSESSHFKRKYPQFENLQKYNLSIRKIYLDAITRQFPTNARWDDIGFPDENNRYIIPNTTLFATERLVSDVPGFWSIPVAMNTGRQVNDCVGINRCCTGFRYGSAPITNDEDCTWYRSCVEWMTRFSHDNMGLDAWAAEKMGFSKGSGYYFSSNSLVISKAWRDQC